MLVFFLLAAVGMVTGLIAQSKGRDFWPWFFYGALIFIVALPHALIMPRNEARADQRLLNAGGRRKCPDCAEIIKAEARVCRFCGHKFEPLPEETGSAPESPPHDLEASDPISKIRPGSPGSQRIEPILSDSLDRDIDDAHRQHQPMLWASPVSIQHEAHGVDSGQKIKIGMFALFGSLVLAGIIGANWHTTPSVAVDCHEVGSQGMIRMALCARSVDVAGYRSYAQTTCEADNQCAILGFWKDGSMVPSETLMTDEQANAEVAVWYHNNHKLLVCSKGVCNDAN